MPSIIAVSNLSKTYASGFQALKRVDLEIRRGEIFALLGPERRRQDDADQHRLRHRQSDRRARVLVDGHDIVADYRAARSLIGLVPQELTTDAFETVWATVSFSRGLFGKPANPAHIEKVLRDLSLWDKQGQQDHDALGRHEAPGDDRQGAVARAADPVPRRADGRRRRRAAARHVGAGARAARHAASRSS